MGIDDAIGGGPSLPRSIEFLVVNNVPVKPERLLRDLAWDRLLSEGSALDPLHRAAAREQVRVRKELNSNSWSMPWGFV